MKPGALNEEASTGYLAYFIICLFVGIFLYIALGPAFDLTLGIFNSQITAANMAGAVLPVSQERIDTINFLIIFIRSIRFLVIILPLIIYGIIVALRNRDDSI